MMIKKTLGALVVISFISSSYAVYAPTARPLSLNKHHQEKKQSNGLSPTELEILKQIPSKERNNYYSPEEGGQLLSMIISINGQYIAFMGHQKLVVGSYVGNMKVTQVTQHHITLKDAHNSVTLSLTGQAHIHAVPDTAPYSPKQTVTRKPS